VYYVSGEWGIQVIARTLVSQLSNYNGGCGILGRRSNRWHDPNKDPRGVNYEE